MVRVLAVADELVASLWAPGVTRHAPDVVLAAGDLPADYLDYLTSTLDVPLVYVPGNHDPDLSGYRLGRGGLVLRGGLPAEAPGPVGGSNADGRVVDVAGLRVAGLGGSPRYSPGPNQYTGREQSRRARLLALRAGWRRLRDGRRVDVLLTHAPPLGVGDAPDPPHQGFAALHRLVAGLHPTYLLHGHVHPYGAGAPDLFLGTTRVCNVVGYRLIEVATPGPVPTTVDRSR